MAITPMADADPFRKIVESQFRVYETRSEPMPGGGTAHMYFLMFPPEELEQRYESVREKLLAEDRELIVFLRREGGEDILVVAPRMPVRDEGTKLNWILLVLSLITTMMAGAIYWQGYAHVDEPWTWSALWSPEHLMWGFIWYAFPLMLILGIHETAHYLAAKRHGLRATLPYFLPFPPFFFPIGTLGAFIRLKDPLPDRKALFDVGASGPIAGFIVAVPIILLGAVLTADTAVDVPDRDRPEMHLDAQHVLDASETGKTVLTFVSPQNGTYVLGVTAPGDVDGRWEFTTTARMVVDGESRSESFTAKASPGETALRTITVPANATSAAVTIEWDDGLVRFGDPLFVKGIDLIGFGDQAYLTHPTFFAGWVGLLITGINLLPAGQLDGGHVARAVLGDKMRYAAYAAVGLLFYLAFQFQVWIIMALFILFMGITHPPPLNDRVPLDGKRIALAVMVLIVLVVTFVPRPVIF